MANSLLSPLSIDVQRSVNLWPEDENNYVISNQLLFLPTNNTSKIRKIKI